MEGKVSTSFSLVSGRKINVSLELAKLIKTREMEGHFFSIPKCRQKMCVL